jgi:hypothetical protein
MLERTNHQCISCLPLTDSPHFQEFISKKQLQCSSKPNYCDQRIPFVPNQIDGRDIGCIGIDHPNCPKNPQKQK